MGEELRINQIIKEKGMAKADLAKLAGISRVGLFKALKGETTTTTLRKLAKALNVPITDLFDKPLADQPPATTATCPSCGAELKLTVTQ